MAEGGRGRGEEGGEAAVVDGSGCGGGGDLLLMQEGGRRRGEGHGSLGLAEGEEGLGH